MKIYTSYSWDEDDNFEWVKKLKTDLEDKNLKIIYDRDELKKSQINIHRFIDEGMREADYIIVVITPSYIKKANKKYTRNKSENRSWVEIENDYIISRRHNNMESLIPIIMKKDNEAKLPDNLEGLNYFDMSNEELYDSELKRLKGLLHNIEENSCIKNKFEIENEYKISKKNNEDLIDYDMSNENIDKSAFDINFNITENPIKISTEIIYNNMKFMLNNNQTISLMLKYYSEEAISDNRVVSSEYLITDYFNIEISCNQYQKVITKIKEQIQNYIYKIEKFEADFEVGEFKLLNNDFCYELFKIDKKYWSMLIDTANKHDWDNGKTQWHIFQRNNSCVHVYAPIISYNTNLNSGQHAFFRAVKDDSMYYDYVKIYVSAIDIINSDFNGYKISKRDAWGVRTAYKWFKNDFIPFACRNKNLKIEEVLSSDNYIYPKEDIFSEMQSFYMSSRVMVSFDEIIQLRNILCYCLSKEFPNDSYNYITSKLGISNIDLSKSDQIISEKIRDILNSNIFVNKINKYGMNSSLADDLFRCIKVFTDGFSNYNLDEQDLEYIKNLSTPFIKKMRNIKLLEKYRYN